MMLIGKSKYSKNYLSQDDIDQKYQDGLISVLLFQIIKTWGSKAVCSNCKKSSLVVRTEVWEANT